MSWFRRWWPAFFWAFVISIFSTAAFTAERTGNFFIPLFRLLLPHASMETLNFLHFLVRKSAHFVEYFILSLLILRGFRAGRRGLEPSWVLGTILLVAAYAALDEFHQSFVPGRTAAAADVLLDTTGGLAAQLVVLLLGALHLLVMRRREKSSEKAGVARAVGPE